MERRFDSPEAVMDWALQLAARGAGFVEPNPMVGAVIVDDQLNCLGEGYHQRFGGPHAEINALRQTGERARGSTLFVTLEPCCHWGKTPPCTAAVLAAGVKRVVVATLDPFPEVAGQGVAKLREAGLTVDVGMRESEAVALTAPFRTLIQRGRPFVIAKWAMSLDGKLAARTGQSKWISNEASRAIVHQLRGRMDAILVGIGTVLADDPLLTARPAGPRTPTRIVLDSQLRLPFGSNLVQSARQVPVLVFTSESAPKDRRASLANAGVEVVVNPTESQGRLDLSTCLKDLASRMMTNVLIEGGSSILGGFHDQQLIDEVHAFIAPRLIGGQLAPGPVGGHGLSSPELSSLLNLTVEQVESDIYMHGRMVQSR